MGGPGAQKKAKRVEPLGGESGHQGGAAASVAKIKAGAGVQKKLKAIQAAGRGGAHQGSDRAPAFPVQGAKAGEQKGKAGRIGLGGQKQKLAPIAGRKIKAGREKMAQNLARSMLDGEFEGVKNLRGGLGGGVQAACRQKTIDVRVRGVGNLHGDHQQGLTAETIAIGAARNAGSASQKKIEASGAIAKKRPGERGMAMTIVMKVNVGMGPKKALQARGVIKIDGRENARGDIGIRHGRIIARKGASGRKQGPSQTDQSLGGEP